MNKELNKILSETKSKLFSELSASSSAAYFNNALGFLKAEGKSSFPKTIEAINKYKKHKAKFEEVGEIASKIFMTECVDGNLDDFKGYMLSVPMLS